MHRHGPHVQLPILIVFIIVHTVVPLNLVIVEPPIHEVVALIHIHPVPVHLTLHVL
jgi:hypothetical protein